MKRSYLFLIATLITLFSVLPAHQAKALEDYSQDYWTLEEITALREEAKQEVLNYCWYSENPACMEEYHSETFAQRGDEYRAVDNVDAYRFLITAVNPSKNTVRMMFFEDNMMDTYITGELYDDNINELYLFWFDLGWLGYDFYNEYQAGALPSRTHLLFAKDNLAESFPPREEITYELDGNVSENYRNMIYYFFITANNLRYMDPIDYNSCINHPSYHEGMECRLFFSKNGGDFAYLPFTPSDLVEEEPTPEDPISEEPTVENPTAEEPISIEDPIQTEEPIIDAPLAPNTGVNYITSEMKCERRIEFPWWIILLIALGEILIIWWFSPSHKKPQKN